jgi:hypothetical protein
MPLRIVEYGREWESAVRDFNARLDAGGVMSEMRLPERAPGDEAGKGYAQPLWAEQFLAVDGEAVRGGYRLQHQKFNFAGEEQGMACLQLPLSEGIVNRAHVTVGMQLVRDALKRQPWLFALGMGGCGTPVAKLLQALRFRVSALPFLFRVMRPVRFLRQIRPLRQSAWRRAASDVAAATGLGWAGIHLLQHVRALKGSGGVEAERVRGFGEWADELWTASKRSYRFCAVRDSRTLNHLYPPESERTICLRVRRGGRTVGWAVVIDSAMRDHKYFANLRVGTIVDCFGGLEDAGGVMAGAADFLAARGVDLVVSNQGHPAWAEALRGAGFLDGPSNFALAASPEIVKHLREGFGEIHVNRGDGDGPIHL